MAGERSGVQGRGARAPMRRGARGAAQDLRPMVGRGAVLDRAGRRPCPRSHAFKKVEKRAWHGPVERGGARAGGAGERARGVQIFRPPWR